MHALGIYKSILEIVLKMLRSRPNIFSGLYYVCKTFEDFPDVIAPDYIIVSRTSQSM